jgi:uncharacterized protein YraI
LKPAGDFVNVRAGPDVNTERLGQINLGQSAQVRGKNADGTWWQISFSGGPGGLAWVYALLVDFTGDATKVPVVRATSATTTTTPVTTTAATTTTATTTTTLQAPFIRLKADQDFANVRTGPDVAYQRVGELRAPNNAASVKGKSEAGTWWQISFPSAPGGVAWVFGQLVDFTGDANAAPIVRVAPPPPTPTAAAPAAPAATATPAQAAVQPTPTVLPAAVLPYSQSDRFEPRNDIGDVPLGHQGGSKTATWTWNINGATKAELEITAAPGPGIFSNCPAGNLASITPNDAAGKRIPVQLPTGSYQFTINDKGYYLFTLYITKADGSTTTIPRNVIVDCYKTQ